MSNNLENPNDQFVMAQFADETAAPRRPSRWAILAVILGMATLVLGPVLYMGLPREMSRWHQAAAEEARLDGDKEQAYDKIDQALQWWPENNGALLDRATWRQQDGDYQSSLEDCNRLLEAEDDEQILLQRTVALQHLGRHDEAIKDWKALVEKHYRSPQQTRAIVLNGLAYAQAVGNTELDEALKNVEQALQLTGDTPEMIDTRGYIHLLRGDTDAAVKDLNAAVEQIEAKLQKAVESRVYYDQRIYDSELDLMRHSVAVVVYHRALLWKEKKEDEKADKDRQRVRELGFEPNDSLF